MPPSLTIRTRLTIGLAAFLLVLTSLAVFTIVRLVVINRQTEEVSRQWLEGIELLDEVGDRMAGFRIAELSGEIAAAPEARDDAAHIAGEQRRDLERAYAQYVVVAAGSARDAMALRAALDAWFAGHDAWAASRANGASGIGGTVEQRSDHALLAGLYRGADRALLQLLDRNRAQMEAEEATTNRLVHSTIIAVVVVCVLAPLVGIVLLLRMRRRLTEPLVAITAALSRLAAGDRDVAFPALRRSDEIGAMANAFEVFRASADDVRRAHEAARAAERQAQQLANHDALTGLPNRRAFLVELEAAVERARGGTAAYLIAIVDLDGFKPINDLQGHAAGDEVLCEIARRLREAFRPEDLVARFGGDEFALIVGSSRQAYPQQAHELAERLAQAIAAPAAGAGLAGLGASVGIARCPADGLDPQDLLRAADIAMYRAKKDGGRQYRLFEPAMEEELRAQTELETALRGAIDADLIVPHYQPLIDMQEQRLHGIEILARWHDPKHGAVPPEVFVPLAEHAGLISQMTAQLLRRACRDARQWPVAVDMALNVSPSQLKDPAFATRFVRLLQEEDYPPARLAIEVTETALIADVHGANSVLSMLRALGIRILLDDFGTGYSSLSLLRQVRFDMLKIDRSFVASLHESAGSATIVAAMVRLANALELPVIAEGIEDGETAATLARIGCRYGQGFYFGKAMDAQAMAAYLA